MSNGEQRQRGRPKKSEPEVAVSFRMPMAQANYLLLLGRKFGWGAEINDVVRAVLVREVMRLQEADFHDKVIPGLD